VTLPGGRHACVVMELRVSSRPACTRRGEDSLSLSRFELDIGPEGLRMGDEVLKALFKEDDPVDQLREVRRRASRPIPGIGDGETCSVRGNARARRWPWRHR
jgi:hypothetical protein